MKPMILVIVGTAMLMLALHHTDDTTKLQDQRDVRRKPVTGLREKVPDSETFRRAVIWLQRLQ